MLGRRNGNGDHDRALSSLIDLYLLRCEVEGKSPFTVVAYRETLCLFQRIGEEEGVPAHVPAITPAHIYAYLGRVAETGVSLETRHRRHREVRSFFSWLERMGYIEESPFGRIKNVRLPQKIVEPYTPEEVGRILSVCDERSELGARDRAIVLLLLDCGLRLNELVQLELGDVDFEEQRIRVRCGKGNKQRVVRFGERAKEAVWDYVGHYRGREEGQLFRSSKAGQPLTRNLIRVRMQHLGRVAGVAKTHAHRFRHTFATWAIENDARELDVQYLLGHSTPAMVRRYSATYNAEKAARAHARWSPGDMLNGRVAADPTSA
jgi:integrase/recombinase XerC